jgi:hypothetical protein
LQLAEEEMDRADRVRTEPLVRIGGICGETAQALREAKLLSDLGYHAGLLSLTALAEAETLSRGQKEEIDRVYAAYPHLNDEFVRQRLDDWFTP